MNRRSRLRRVVEHTVWIGTVSEAPLPRADVIDASHRGVLVAFAEPVGLLAGQRACVSFTLPDGALHLMASVVRVERGDDFRTYVGLALDDARPGGAIGPSSDPELVRWFAWLDGNVSQTSDRRSARRAAPTPRPSDDRPTERAAVSRRLTG